MGGGGGVEDVGIRGRLFVYFDPSDVSVSNLPMHKQSCNSWKGKKVLKQCETNFSDS